MPGAGDAVMNERNSFKEEITRVRQEEKIEQMGTYGTYKRWES